jgi:hypothetical protein
MAESQADQTVAIGFAGLVLSVFIVGVLVGDGVALWRLSSQFQSTFYPKVPGRIVRSQVDSEAGNRRRLSSHKVNLGFQYEVGGKSYESSSYRFLETLSHQEDAVRKTVEEHPPGRAVDVYYNPSNPAQAVLAPGLNASDFVFLHLLIPFNGVVAFLALATWYNLRARSRPAGGASIVERVDEIRIRTGHFTPFMIALILMSIVSLVVAAALMFVTDIDVSPLVATLAWLSVPVAFVVFYLRFRTRGEIVLDSRNGTITLPVSRDQPEAVTVPWSEVTGLGFSEVIGRNKEGVPTGKSYAVKLNWTNSGQDWTATLARWETRDLAKALLIWLHPRIMGSNWIAPAYRHVAAPA